MNCEALIELGTAEYWNKRYEIIPEIAGTTREWYRTFDKLRPFLLRVLPEVDCRPRILHLGCGDSVRLLLNRLPTPQSVSSTS